MTIATNLDKLRLELGDTDTDAELFQDDELEYFLDAESDDVMSACLRAAEAAARKYARAFNFTTDGQSFNRSDIAKAYRDLAADLRKQGIKTSLDVLGISTLVPTRVDGYSDDIAADEVQTATRPAGRRGYYRVGLPDLP